MFDAKKFLADVSHEPGVYRMYDDKDQVIYVGKNVFQAIFVKI